MTFREPNWGKSSSGTRKDKKKETLSQRELLINSSDNDSDDQEWIQQLERDYGKRLQKQKKKWTRLEKVLIACVLSCFIFVVFLLTALLYSRYKHGETFLQFTLGGPRLCDHKSCVEASYSFSANMDYSENPCQSFYNHACGSFLKGSEFSNFKESALQRVSENNLNKIKSTLTTIKTGGGIISKVRRYYEACLKKDFIEQNSNQSLIDLINYVESWAITNETAWNGEQWNFGQALMRIHHLKSTPLFYMYVAPDDKNSSNNIIKIEQAGLTLGDEKLYSLPEHDKIVLSYKKFMNNIGQLLGAHRETSEKGMEEVFEFEKKLASVYEKKSHGTDHTKMTVADLLSLCPAIPWLDYLNNMFKHAVKSDEPVVVYTPHFLKSMSDLVIKTERRIIANYMVWHLIKPVLTLFSKPYRMAVLEFSKNEISAKGVEDGWRGCISKTDSVFGFATGYLLIQEMEKVGFFKKEVEKMSAMIKEAFIHNIQKLNWMDDITKRLAEEKANSIIEMVGYPNWLKNIDALNKFYENLTVTDNPLRNYFNAREFFHERMMERRGHPVQKDEWHMMPTEVNVFFNSPNNVIAVPAGIIQSPFFDSGFPIAINYGALGSMIGNALTHGFDLQGQHFDKFGNLVNWWSKPTASMFANYSKCFENQHDSQDTQSVDYSEIIADNGGVKMAFNAFKTSSYIRGEDKLLPGLQMTPNQMFFMGYAQTMCSVQKEHAKKFFQKERVDMVLRNNEDFSTAFNCPVGSKMNPVKKCHVW
ncbi:endothelin-converting enzyme homolog isoform X2 [Hydra vulgaris]|uniref:Endothelin-converting enzyme homolog isoform X2 n=1 Tax=Hydra vulgaris TaxID=6087 RepID=A0ABM4CIR9_HYDVU